MKCVGTKYQISNKTYQKNGILTDYINFISETAKIIKIQTNKAYSYNI